MGSKENELSPGSRLCHIKKWDHFDGYGFNLHAEKGKPGQYIGKVDENSPAEAAGLRQGDRILEVNGESIAAKTHKQVVELIKQQSDETKLLVIDPVDEDGGNGTIVTPATIDSNNITNSTASNADTNDSTTSTVANSDEVASNDSSNGMSSTKNGSAQLNLSMTAAELRAKLASKKKFDPKKESMDFKQKFDIVQKL